MSEATAEKIAALLFAARGGFFYIISHGFVPRRHRQAVPRYDAG
jgi:hypothetical protein